jgi:hypothetical protein
MGIKMNRIIVSCAFLIPVFEGCKRTEVFCPKEGYEYVNTSSFYFYSPGLDSVPVGSTFIMTGAIPKTFTDDLTNTVVRNTTSSAIGSLGVGMIYPEFKAAVDSFEILPEVGEVRKETGQFTEGQLKGFRSIVWVDNGGDSLQIRLKIRALARGVYALAVRQQASKDSDCALFKYFPRPANVDQHLHYWEQYIYPVESAIANTTYCVKVY